MIVSGGTLVEEMNKGIIKLVINYLILFLFIYKKLDIKF